MAEERLLPCVCEQMTGKQSALSKFPVATFPSAPIWFLTCWKCQVKNCSRSFSVGVFNHIIIAFLFTCVDSLVNFKVARTGEELVAAVKIASEYFALIWIVCEGNDCL